jgi:branched-chain amino acid aminotransferase
MVVYFLNEFVHPGDALLPLGNRAFRYGDGVFETLRILKGQVPLLGRHLYRLRSGSSILGMEMNPEWTNDWFRQKVSELLKRNEIQEGGMLRITLYRENGNFYAPSGNKALLVMEAEPLEDQQFGLNAKGLTVDLFNDVRKPLNPLSNLKTLSGLIYVLAGVFRNAKQIDNAILLNDNYNVAEAMNSNVFLVVNGVLYTPTLDEGCLDGVMRRYVIELAGQLGIKVYETAIKPNDMLRADEIFLTNSLRGIQWVGAYRNKRYFNNTSEKLLQYLNLMILQEEGVPEKAN